VPTQRPYSSHAAPVTHSVEVQLVPVVAIVVRMHTPASLHLPSPHSVEQRPLPSQATSVIVGHVPGKSIGQEAETPSQTSAASQVASEGRHTVPALASASASQVPETPLQVSVGSHGP